MDNIPWVGDAINKATEGLVVLLNDAAKYTVRKEAIFEEFRNDGYITVKKIEDIRQLELECIDKTVGLLATKYNSLAAAEGGAIAGGPLLAGPGYPVAMAAAIAADIPIFTGLCLRAIGEYATYYGFDIDEQAERAFMLNILGLSSTTTSTARRAILANLAKIAKNVASNTAWKVLNEHYFVILVKKIAEQFGIRVTKGKLAMVIPAAGVLFNGGVNVYMMNEICNISYILYRERYVAQYRGDPSLIVKCK